MVAPARNVITGGAGADKFVFDSAAYADATAATPIVDHITDYDHGNTGTYSLLEETSWISPFLPNRPPCRTIAKVRFAPLRMQANICQAASRR